MNKCKHKNIQNVSLPKKKPGKYLWLSKIYSWIKPWLCTLRIFRNKIVSYKHLDHLFYEKFKKVNMALAGVAQWIEHWPENYSIASSIPSQGTCLGCRPGPQ